jgi:hypothetical protein
MIVFLVNVRVDVAFDLIFISEIVGVDQAFDFRFTPTNLGRLLTRDAAHLGFEGNYFVIVFPFFDVISAVVAEGIFGGLLDIHLDLRYSMKQSVHMPALASTKMH